MPPDPHPLAVARLLVTAVDWPGVQRVVVLLTARGYAVDSFAATPSTPPGSWEVRLVLRCRPAELLLLSARLERLPSVTSVRTGRPAGERPAP